MPFAMGSYPTAVVVKGKVYIGGGWAPSDEHKQTMMEYDPYRDEWTTLAPYNHTHFGMAVWKDHVVLVGGIHVTTKEQSPILGVLADATWKHPFLQMPTARRSPTVVTFDNRWLIVIGGKCKDDGTQLSDVEVLDTTSGCWYKCAPLPHPLSHGSAATIGNTCYVLGGFLSRGSPSKKVFSVSLEDLIAQAMSSQLSASSSALTPSCTLWQTLPDTPLIYSTAVAINGALLAIGGEWMWLTNRVIYAYQPANSNHNWVKVGVLPTGRTRCACTVLSSVAIVVAGGSTSIDSSLSQTVEIAELL